jgi:hypothetical protein
LARELLLKLLLIIFNQIQGNGAGISIIVPSKSVPCLRRPLFIQSDISQLGKKTAGDISKGLVNFPWLIYTVIQFKSL